MVRESSGVFTLSKPVECKKNWVLIHVKNEVGKRRLFYMNSEDVGDVQRAAFRNLRLGEEVYIDFWMPATSYRNQPRLVDTSPRLWYTPFRLVRQATRVWQRPAEAPK